MDKIRDKRLSDFLILGQQGHAKAYESFLREVSSLLYNFLLSRTSSETDLEDILQETLLSIHRARHSYSPGRPVGPWIYAICENRIIDHARKRLRTERIKEAWKNEPREPADAKAECKPMASLILEQIKMLPKKQRLIIGLLKLQGFSVSEVAAQTGMSKSAVKVSAFRGYETLRKILGVNKDEN